MILSAPVCESCGRGAGCNCAPLPTHCDECSKPYSPTVRPSYVDDYCCTECAVVRYPDEMALSD